jgi:hypothetical protein
MKNNTTGNFNVSVGGYSMQNNITGNNNSSFGNGANQSNTAGHNNSSFGYQTMQFNNVSDNTAFGFQALQNNGKFTTAGSLNCAVGVQAMQNAAGTNNTQNVGIGYRTLYNNAGGGNVGVGHQALMANVSGFNNTAVGQNALLNNTASNITAVGNGVLAANTGSSNTAVGAGTLPNNSSGQGNSAFGMGTMENNTTGGFNAAFGGGALNNNVNGYNNSAFGVYAGQNTTGINNTCLGYSTNTGTYAQSTAIGAYATATASNQIMLGTATETVVHPGKTSCLGSLALNQNILYIKESTDSSHTLQWNAGIDGAILKGGLAIQLSANGTTGILNSSGFTLSAGTMTVPALNVSGFSMLNSGSAGEVVVAQSLYNYGSFPGTKAGLQIGWNNNSGTGYTDFLNNGQGGTAGFKFWYIKETVTTPIAILTMDPVEVVSNVQISAPSFNATSDYRIKDDVETLDARFSVDKLRPVFYTQTQQKSKCIGFIAHELQKHFPYLVNGQKDGEQHQSINYIGLIGVLTHEIQGLKGREEAAAHEIQGLKGREAAAATKIQELSRLNLAIATEIQGLAQRERLAAAEIRGLKRREAATETEIQSLRSAIASLALEFIER